jgi:transcriptional regulator with XRE-family HTH domain
MPVVSRWQRPADRGAEIGRERLRVVGREIRLARRSRGLSMRAVGEAVGVSEAWISRIERALVTDIGLVILARMCAVVGLDLAVRTFAGGRPITDAGHSRLLERLRRRIHRSVSMSVEVPLPIAGDQRAWDASLVGAHRAWRYGVEAETNPLDGQAIVRRIQLKLRDGAVYGVILLLPETRQSRAFRREFGPLMVRDFPVAGSIALQRLEAGLDPGGNAVVVL